MRFSTLEAWLAWQETLHPNAIELGLGRVAEVHDALGARSPAPIVVTVAGTNGKGSSVAMLESILRAAGYRVGAYTSPHLLRYNERVRVDGIEASDDQLCAAFERVDEARGTLSLTYFEFGTLAAFEVFAGAALDVAVLEVGMGGRLDAVNIIDADIALITALSVDHQQWLGKDRESIAREKAGIMRGGRPAVCSDPAPPQALLTHARDIGAVLNLLGREFAVQAHASDWAWSSSTRRRDALPYPALRGRHQLNNAAGVLMVLELLQEELPVTQGDVRRGLLEVNLPGRFQVLPGVSPTLIFDVTHNPAGARVLADLLRQHPCVGRTLAVVGMLADKDITGILQELTALVDAWYVTAPAQARAAPVSQLTAALSALEVRVPVRALSSVREASVLAMHEAQAGDRVLVFGSFYTVAEAAREAL